MIIRKFNGKTQNFDPNKILKRIRDQAEGLSVDSELLFKKAINGVVDGMSTTDIDNLLAMSAGELITSHPDYSLLAARIIITRQGKIIGKKPKDTDFLFDFFGIRSFLYKYSLRNDKKEPIELPHMMSERVAKFFGKTKEESDLFYTFLSQRKFTGATPFLVNGGTSNKNFISCFVKDTQVLTKNGFKNIQDCTRSDEVITHTNKFKKILNIFKNKRLDRDLYNIKVYGTPIITATENHKFLSYNSKLQSLGKNPEFIELKNIRVGDFIKSVSDETLKINSEIIKISNYIDIINKDWRTYKATLTTKIIDIESVETENEFQYNVTYENKRGTHLMKKYHSSIKQFEITPEFAKFIGLYYGDGNLLKTKQQGIVGINITCATKAQNIVEFVQYISKKYFNIEPKIYNSYSKDGRSWIKCSIHSRILGILFKELFGEYFDKKKIYRGIYDWDKKLLDGLLAGLISSDGNVTKKGDVRFQIANPTLVKELFGIFKKGGYDTRLSIATQYNDKLNGDKRATQYRLDFGAQNELLQYITKSYNDDRLEKIYNAKQRFIIKIGNDTFYRVQSISQSNNIDEFVYDIEVEDDHSYCVEGLIVHNCNLTTLEDDSLIGIENTLTDLAKSSSDGAGIGLHAHNLRSEKTLVSKFKGTAGGIVRFFDMVQSKMRFYKQGNRSGSAAGYLGIWHLDIMEFVKLTLQVGDEKRRTRDLFTAVCIPDLFYELLLESINSGEDKLWYTFCPHDIIKAKQKPLHFTWGEEFKELYYKYIELGLGTPISVKGLWDLILRAMVESGKPYIFNWDNANRKNNQKHLGNITGSNLCVSGDTDILTRDGYRCIEDLVGQEVEIWNGEEWSLVTIVKTGENQRLVSVTTGRGNTLRCTPYHKWYDSKGKQITTDDLEVGTNLLPWKDPFTGEMINEPVIDIDKKDYGLRENTYCFLEPKRNMGVFNGILTGNCIEVTQVTRPKYTAQCALASINLANNLTLEEIKESAKVATLFLNRGIDKNKWSTEAAKTAGLEQRAIAIGVSGMADHLAILGMTYEESVEYQGKIIETIYKAALEESHRIAVEENIVFDSWEDSVYNLGGQQGDLSFENYSVANSLFVGLMPTASTSALVGVNESFEAFASMIFVRQIDTGEFTMVNKYLVKDLEKLGLWDSSMSNEIIQNSGSIQDIDRIPQRLKDIYKTIWEIKPRIILDAAISRQKWVDQSQSMNMYYASPKTSTITTSLLYAWQNGLKTGVYYTKTMPALNKPKRLGQTVQEPKTTTTLNNGWEISCHGCSA